MDKVELKRRTQTFAIDAIKFLESLPDTRTVRVLSHQLLRSSTSVGANYRSACKAKSTANFINKIVIVEKEADESIYWLELIEQTVPVNQFKLLSLKRKQTSLPLFLQQ